MSTTPPEPELEPMPAWLVFSMIFLPLAVVGLIVHELGHGLTAQALGGRFLGLWVFPGIELWPEFGDYYTGPFTYFGLTLFAGGPDWSDWQWGLAGLMGTGSTFIISVVALGLLLLLRPKGPCATLFFTLGGLVVSGSVDVCGVPAAWSATLDCHRWHDGRTCCRCRAYGHGRHPVHGDGLGRLRGHDVSHLARLSATSCLRCLSPQISQICHKVGWFAEE